MRSLYFICKPERGAGLVVFRMGMGLVLTSSRVVQVALFFFLVTLTNMAGILSTEEERVRERWKPSDGENLRVTGCSNSSAYWLTS